MHSLSVSDERYIALWMRTFKVWHVSQCKVFYLPTCLSSFAIPIDQLTVRRPDFSFSRSEPWIPNVSPNLRARTVRTLVVDTVSPFLTVSTTDIDGYIAIAQNSLSLYPRSHFEHILGVHTLTMAWFDRYILSQQKEDLDKSIAHCTEAILLPPVSRAGLFLNVVQLLFHLALALLHRAMKFKQPESVNPSIEYFRYLRGQALDSFLPRNIITTTLIRKIRETSESSLPHFHP